MLKQVLIRTLSLSMLSLAAGGVWADDAWRWLERMSHAHREMSYQGVVTYQIDDRLKSYQFTHRVDGGREFESLQPLDSDADGLVRQGHRVDCVHPAERLLRNQTAANGTGDMAQYYELSLGEPGRVAGRDVVTLDIMPRDAFRLSHHIALDVMTAIPLKTETRDQSGKVLERFQFMMFEVGAAEDAAVADSAREIHHGELLPAEAEAQLLGEMAWQPAWIPDGFTLAQFKDPGSEALSYTDGISMFSVFMESGGGPAVSPSASSMRSGATVSYSYPIPDSNLVTTVIGEVPLLTAEQVAKSVAVKR